MPPATCLLCVDISIGTCPYTFSRRSLQEV